MHQEMGDFMKSKPDKDRAERSVDEFKRLSGRGNSQGRRFDRDRIHDRLSNSVTGDGATPNKSQNPNTSCKERG
jgi:hypothetical protein